MNEEKKKNVNGEYNVLINPTPISITTPKKQNINFDYKDEKGRKLTFANISVTKSSNPSNYLYINSSEKPENHLLNLNLLKVENINKFPNPSLQISEIDSKEQRENYDNLKSIIEVSKNNESIKNNNSKYKSNNVSSINNKSNINISSNNLSNYNNINNSNIESNKEKELIASLSLSRKTSSNKIKFQEFYLNNNIKKQRIKSQKQ